MKKHKLIIVLAITLLSGVSIFSQDLKVFDLEFDKPISVRECKYKVVEEKQSTGKYSIIFDRSKNQKVRQYQYLKETLVNDTCFQRYNDSSFVNWTSESLPILTAPKNSILFINYSQETKPSIMYSNDIMAWIDKNGSLTGVRFITPVNKSNEILQVLVNKYGKYSSGKTYETTEIRDIREFSIFKWNLNIFYIQYDTEYSDSRAGRVEISYTPKKFAPKDNNPL